MPTKRKNNRNSLKTMSPGWTLPVTPATTPVSVVSVQQSAPNTLIWTFSSSVSVTGSNVPQFQASGDGVTFVSPTSVTVGGGDGTTVTAVYASGQSLRALKSTMPNRRKAARTTASPVILGSIFRVITLPTNVSFTDGPLSLPQSGQVTLPSLSAKKSEIPRVAQNAPKSLKLPRIPRAVVARRKAA